MVYLILPSRPAPALRHLKGHIDIGQIGTRTHKPVAYPFGQQHSVALVVIKQGIVVGQLRSPLAVLHEYGLLPHVAGAHAGQYAGIGIPLRVQWEYLSRSRLETQSPVVASHVGIGAALADHNAVAGEHIAHTLQTVLEIVRTQPEPQIALQRCQPVALELIERV